MGMMNVNLNPDEYRTLAFIRDPASPRTRLGYVNVADLPPVADVEETLNRLLDLGLIEEPILGQFTVSDLAERVTISEAA